MASIKTNVVYSSILSIAGYLFPLLTYPYVTRVLGVEYLGSNNFVDSIVNYFTFLSMMGMGVLGVREIAKCKTDKYKLSRTFSSLVALNLITSLFAIIVLFICVSFSSRLQEYNELFYIGAARILFNTLLIEWFFKGIENFKFITIRSLIIRVVYVVSVFVFIRCPQDYKLYFFLTSSVTFLNALWNIFYSTRFVHFSIKDVYIKSYWSPFILLGIYQLLVTTYTTFNAIYLGFVTNDIQVGYYTVVTKLYYIILSVFTAFTGVMLPRMSALNADGSIDTYKTLVDKSINVLFLIAFPIIILTEICAPQIIGLLAGEEYYHSIIIARIIMPLIFIVGYEQILVVQILTSLGKDKDILKTSVIGVSTAMLLNIILVPILYSVGSAIVWVISELSVLVASQFFVTKYTGLRFPFKMFFVNILYALPIVILGLILMILTSYNLISLFIFLLLLSLYYFVIEWYVMKNQVVISLANTIISHFQSSSNQNN